MYEIIIGRDEEDRKKFGTQAVFLLGKHYVKMGQTTSLSNEVYMDAARSHVVFIVGKRGSGKCIEENTLIPLSDGSLVPIKDLEGNLSSIFSLDNRLKIKEAKREGFFKRKVSKLLHIKLRSGKEIKLTLEHPLLTVTGWKEAKELKLGSRIATPRIINTFGNSSLTNAEIKLLAYLIAEGHVKQGILFSNSDEEILNDFKCALEEFDSKLDFVELSHGQFRVYSRRKTKVLGYKTVRDSIGRFSKGSSVTVEKTSIRQFLEKHSLFGKLSTEKTIPKAIFKLSKEKLALFLNRLFSCDGSLYKSRKGTRFRWEISYSSSSEVLIRQVQHLLLRFSILSRIRHKEIKYNNKLFISFEIIIGSEHLLTFIDEIGFFGKKQQKERIAKEETIVVKRNPNVDTIPKELWEIYKPKSWAAIGRAINYAYPKAMRESQRYSPSRQKLLQIAKTDENEFIYLLSTSDIFWDEIDSIEELSGEFTVYDITAPKLHNFVANDIIVHNSYSLGVFAEGLATLPQDISQNLAVIMLDTMGIFWTMKYENKKDAALLEEWKLKPQGLNIVIYTPVGYYQDFKNKGIPTDFPFSIKPSELSSEDWCLIFKIDINEAIGVLITRVINRLKNARPNFSIEEIIAEIRADKRSEQQIKDAAENRFLNAINWGLFSEKGTEFSSLAIGGQITVLDVSCYATTPGGESIKALVIGLVAEKLFLERMVVRRAEEYEELKQTMSYFGEKEKFIKKEMPLVWMIIDESHEFLPKHGITPATKALLTLLREGRQPGVSLVLASQQPGQIHTDVLTQSDTVIAHRLTAKVDTEALGALMQSYMREGLDKALNELPDVNGAAIIFDDTNERIYPMRVRPRFTWHGGEAPTPFQLKKKIFEI